MDRVQDRLQPEAVAHGERELGEHFAGVRAHDRHAEKAVASRPGQRLDETAVGALDDRAVEFAQIVARDLIGEAALARLDLVEADARDLGVGVDRRRGKREAPPGRT